MEFEKINSIPGVELHLNISLERYTTLRLEAQGNLAVVKSIEALSELVRNLNPWDYHLVGWGANQVLLGKKELYIKLDLPFDRKIFSEVRDKYVLPASVPLTLLSSHAQKFGLRGWEVFTGVPASLGGAIFMNAGTSLGEICEVVEEVTVLTTKGVVETRKVSAKDFSYRQSNFLKPGEIIVEATLVHLGVEKWISEKIKDYLEYRKSTQPLQARTCGSVFKNLPNNVRAGETIDSIGLKGFGSSSLHVSLKHANFIEHHRGKNHEDFCDLLECLKIDIERYSGHKFELEVKLY